MPPGAIGECNDPYENLAMGILIRYGFKMRQHFSDGGVECLHFAVGLHGAGTVGQQEEM